LKVAASGAGRTAVYASWNGATAVGSWQVLSGTTADASHMAAVAVAPRTGFETSATVASSGPYFAVQALGSSGQVLGTSPAARVSGR
jgi:hypothetical protein